MAFGPDGEIIEGCPVTGAAVCHCDEKNDDGGLTIEHNHTPFPDTDGTLAARKAGEHEAFFDAISTLYGLGDLQREQVAGEGAKVYVAKQSGAWSDPETWLDGEVPGPNALVIIPNDVAPDGAVTPIEVTYDVVPGSAHDVPLYSVFVQGALDFATDQDTRMEVDSLLTDMGSRLTIGDGGNEIGGGNTAQIVIREDTQPSDARPWDPGQFTKGIVTMGAVRIAGEDTTSKLALVEDVEAGATELVFEGEAEGWDVGDTIVLQGTHTDPDGSHADDTRFHDEELEITSVRVENGQTIVAFTNLHTGGNALRFDHTRPDGAEGLNIYAANMTRSVQVSSAAGEESLSVNGGDVHTRGHVMFMHNDDVMVQDASFTDMGRSDKEKLPSEDNNAKGRYALHFHRTGSEDIEGQPAILDGVVIDGSPGWGIVHHQAHLNVLDSVVYETTGSGIVAEAGDEIGIWRDNFVLKVTGTQPAAGDTNASNVDFWTVANPLGNNTFNEASATTAFDFGRAEAYWVQGAGLVKIENNTAASAPTAITFFADSWELANKDAKTVAVGNLRIREEDGTITETDAYRALVAAGYTNEDRIAVGAAPPKGIDGFEAANVDNGVVTWLVMRNPNGDENLNPIYTTGDYNGPIEHDAATTLQDLTLWNVNKNGVLLAHSSQIAVENAMVIGAGDGDIAFNEDPTDLNDVTGVAFGITGDTHHVTFTNTTSTGLEQEFSDAIGIGPREEDRVNGTDGQDVLEAHDKSVDDVYFYGGAGDDLLKGGMGNDILIGGDGNDVIRLSVRNRSSLMEDLRVDRDLAIGGDGDDIFTAQAADNWISHIYGGAGYDQLQIIGGDGYGLVLNRFSAYEQSIEAIAQQEGDPFWGFAGTETADHIDLRGAVIYATTGFDARDGDDIYFGTYQSEEVNGQDGHDFLSGEAGDDILRGGSGDDILRGGAGSNALTGGEGADIIQVGVEGLQKVRDFDPTADRLHLEIPGVDSLADLRVSVVSWNPGNSRRDFRSNNSDETALYITWGDHDLPPEGTFINYGSHAGTGIVLGGFSDFALIQDRIDFVEEHFTPVMDFTHPVAVAAIPDWVDPDDYAAGIDPRRLGEEGPQLDTAADFGIDVSGLERYDLGVGQRTGGSRVSPGVSANGKLGGGYVVGDDGNNRNFGTNHDDVLEGGGGDDFLDLKLGSDIAIGGAGDDLIRSGLRNNGSDENNIDARENPDRYYGGSGHDAVKAGSGGTLGFDDFSRDATSIEEIRASRIVGADYDFDGTFSPENILDFRGVDLLGFSNLTVGGPGRGLPIRAGDGDDIVYGNRVNNRIEGGADNDRLSGESGHDTIEGGAGADIIRGGSGTNILYGEYEPDNRNDIPPVSADVFQIGAGETTTIMDFDIGMDRIESTSALAAVNRIVEPGSRQRDPDIISTELVFENGSTVRLDRIDPVDFNPGTITVVTAFEEWIPGARSEAEWAAIDNPALRGERLIIENYNQGHGTAPSISPPTDSMNPLVPTADIVGTDGNDSLYSGDEAEMLEGLAGDDYLAAGAGDDTLRGDEGDDELWAEGGNDLLDGGTGEDMLAGGSGNDTLNGNGDDDRLWAQEGDDVLNGGGGADLLVGAEGNDTLDGGEDDDALWGQVGDDMLFGGEGADLLAGGLGNDTLSGDGGDDALWAGEGDDVLNGGAGQDLLAGWVGNDTLNGNDGDDALWAEDGDDVLNGGTGEDMLAGGSGNDTLNGNEDDDQLWAQEGDDVLNGGLGDDLLVGGEGDDILTGGVGQDVVYGQSGSDVFVIVEGTIHDVVGDFTAGEDQIDVRAFQNIQNFEDLMARGTDIGGAIQFNLDGGNFLTLIDVSEADLSDADFQIG